MAGGTPANPAMLAVRNEELARLQEFQRFSQPARTCLRPLRLLESTRVLLSVRVRQSLPRRGCVLVALECSGQVGRRLHGAGGRVERQLNRDGVAETDAGRLLD